MTARRSAQCDDIAGYLINALQAAMVVGELAIAARRPTDVLLRATERAVTAFQVLGAVLKQRNARS